MKQQIATWAKRIKSESWIWDDVHSVGAHNHLNILLQEIVPSQTNNLYGTHFIFNNQSNTNLGIDGYDNYQAPKAESGNALFNRRMWVNGHLEYICGGPQVNNLIRCVEIIKAVRSVGSNVFVTIGRNFSGEDGSTVLRELRTLVYTNELYQTPDLDRGGVSINSGVLVGEHLFRYSLNDVMRFSSLSYNLHKIHYDVQYCKQENLANVVASGPLLVATMLRYFLSLFPDAKIKTFKYRNSEPCYIDEDLLLQVKKMGANYDINIVKDERKLCGGVVVLEP